MGDRFSGDDNFHPTTLVQVSGSYVQTRPCLTSVQNLFFKRYFSIPIQMRLVARDHDLILSPFVSSAMGVVTFSGNDLRLSILVKVVPRQSMQLADLLVDQLMLPDSRTIGSWFQFLVPIQSVVVTITPN